MKPSNCGATTTLFLLAVVSASGVLCDLPAVAAQPVAPVPDLVTPRTDERTGFQESRPYGPRYDLRTDFAMAYGIDASLTERLARWREAGYVPHVMTGVAWGQYQDFLNGEVDGREHWDEGQVDARGNPINHGATVPYMVPSVAFADYLEIGVKRAIDAGAVAVHLEEPEFWARAGFSEAFQREWQIFYREPWQRPDSSINAQYRASKLKYYLYRRTLDRLCTAMKEYALARHNREVRFYVPTHSLLNYAQWKIVSPESALLDLPGVDGYIAQVWTGTARTANTYAGRMKERTFETAYLEYGVMQELVRGTNRRMWFLHDPIEDNPGHDWTDYRDNYIRTLVASLLHPGVARYEVCPWPNRVMQGRYPRGREGTGIPADYATTLAVAFNQLRDMEQSEVTQADSTTGVGVFLSDSAMFQRAEPAFTTGVAADGSDPTRATSDEVRDLAGFYGLTLPLLKHGVPVRPVQLDNLARTPGYLDDFKVLVLSYEFMKPMSPGLHLALAEWVRGGGVLLYVGADTDPFHEARDWWNEGLVSYRSPTEHLLQQLGLPRDAAEGDYPCGDGRVIIARRHPAYYTRSADNADEYRQLVRQAVESAGGRLIERNHLVMRRGPYVIASVFDESVSDEPLTLTGRFVDLLDPQLATRTIVTLQPNQQAWLLDLEQTSETRPLLLAAAGRVESWDVQGDALEYVISSPEGTPVAARLLLEREPQAVLIDGQQVDSFEWNAESHSLLLRHAGRAEGVRVRLEGVGGDQP
ncbi:MAG: hypothetical protein KDA44_03410 [Planctomycetales bacterium]|nr:hypothetical protein [Planctomycetales bacterium]